MNAVATGMKTMWMPVAFAAIVAAFLALPAGGPVRIFYPIAALAIGYRLCTIDVPGYIAFLLWLWTLTPLVRRVADYQVGWQESSIVLLTPYLVTAVCLVRPILNAIVFPKPPGLWPPGRSMFLGAALGTLCGVPLGIVTAPAGAIVEMLNWLLPLGLGLFVACHDTELVAIERAVLRALAGIAAVAGAYGIAQFMNPLPWDADWMKYVDMASIGRPEPFAVRVFSTMHSPGVLAYFVLVPLVAWIAAPRISGLISTCLGAMVLLLSQVRTGWVALALSAVLVLAAAPLGRRLRAIAMAMVVAGALVVFVPAPEVADVLVSRAETLGDSPTYDRSTASRAEGHGRALEFASRQPFGAGIGVPVPWVEEVIGTRDSTFVTALVQFGVPGLAFYTVALCLLTGRLWGYYRDAVRPEAVGLACAGIGMLCTTGLGLPAAGPPGMLLWLIAGLAVADARQQQQANVARARQTIVGEDAGEHERLAAAGATWTETAEASS